MNYILKSLRNDNNYANSCRKKAMEMLSTAKTLDQVQAVGMLFDEYQKFECEEDLVSEESKIVDKINELKEEMKKLESQLE